MGDCICTLSCGVALRTFTFEELRVFQTSACGELTRWHGLTREDTWLVLLVCVSIGRDSKGCVGASRTKVG